jgi:RHS repeat-associated protein
LHNIGAATDAGGWVDGAWHTLDPGRNAIEIEWLASTALGANNGLMRLWLNGAWFDAVYQVDNDTLALDSVRLGAMGVDAGTSGTLHLEEFESRRLTYIGLLPDPGVPDAEPPNEPGWVDREYSYASGKPHAVTGVDSLAGLDEYGYDASGNMETRTESTVEWTQTFDEENRLASVSNGTDTWTFVYDGDGNRVKQVNPDGSITLLLGGGIYTVEDAAGNPAITKYYSIAGQRVALNGPDGLQFLLTDHLGSVVGVTDSAGGLLSEQRYLPFGEERLTPGISETDFGFTGQRDLAAVGLMDYNARFYSAGIGRFASADSIVAQMFTPPGLNRYSYVGNNPTNFIDPSGHALCASPDGSCTANYVQPTSAPNPLTSPVTKPRLRTCQIRPEKCRKGGNQILNEITPASVERVIGDDLQIERDLALGIHVGPTRSYNQPAYYSDYIYDPQCTSAACLIGVLDLLSRQPFVYGPESLDPNFWMYYQVKYSLAGITISDIYFVNTSGYKVQVEAMSIQSGSSGSQININKILPEDSTFSWLGGGEGFLLEINPISLRGDTPVLITLDIRYEFPGTGLTILPISAAASPLPAFR